MLLVQAPHNHQKYAFISVSLSSGNNPLPDAKAGLSRGRSQSRSSCRPLVSADTPPRTSVFAFVLSWPFWCVCGGFCLLSNTVWRLAFCFSKVFNFTFSPKKFSSQQKSGRGNQPTPRVSNVATQLANTLWSGPLPGPALCPRLTSTATVLSLSQGKCSCIGSVRL